MAKEKLSKGLVIPEDISKLILDGSKKMLVRGCRTNKRDSVGILKNITGQVIGAIGIVECIELNEFKFNAYRAWHKLECEFKDLKHKRVFGWVLDDPRKFKKPISHKFEKNNHSCWINLDIKI